MIGNEPVLTGSGSNVACAADRPCPEAAGMPLLEDQSKVEHLCASSPGGLHPKRVPCLSQQGWHDCCLGSQRWALSCAQAGPKELPAPLQNPCRLQMPPLPVHSLIELYLHAATFLLVQCRTV